MQTPPHSLVASFERELKLVDENCRVVWGEMDYGIHRWVIQRHLAPDIYAECLRNFQEMHPGESRYFDQKRTDDNGKVIFTTRFDRIGEWSLERIIEDTRFDIDDDRGYRLPDRRDLIDIQRRLKDVRTQERKIRDMVQEENRARDALKRQRVEFLTKEIKNGKTLWGDEVVDLGRRPAMEGTEI